MARMSETYRSSRRNEAKRRGLVWRTLKRAFTPEGNAYVVVPPQQGLVKAR